jgi:hypothetical protein
MNLSFLGRADNIPVCDQSQQFLLFVFAVCLEEIELLMRLKFEGDGR